MFKVKQKVFFHCTREGQQCFGGEKTIFGRRYGLPDFIFLFLFDLGTCVQKSHIHQSCEGLPKIYFLQRGIMKFTYKGRFLTIKIAYEKFLD
jgi:hypothetical protein